MTGEPIRVLVVDDDPMVCAYLRSMLTAAGDIDVVDEAYDGAAAVEAAIRHRPRVVLMDLRMPGVDGFAAMERLATFSPTPVVLALTTFDTDEHIVRALRVGAAGFLVKSTLPEDLVGLVRVAARDHGVFSRGATTALLGAVTGRRADGAGDARIDSLTEREAEVLAGLGEGLPNADIARNLHLSEVTVKGYVTRILAKLGCGNRTQAALIAHNLARHGGRHGAPAAGRRSP